MSRKDTAPQIPIKPQDQTRTVLKAAVIDDAFDAIGENEISLDEIRAFHQLADEEGELDKILSELSIEKPDLVNLDDNDPEIITYLNTLWQILGKYPKLNNHIEILFNKRVEKLIDLNKICANLKSAGIEIKEFGSELTEDDLKQFIDGNFSFVFVDYYLGANENTQAIAKAEKQAQLIFDNCPSEYKPVTILMSSHHDVRQVKNNFRENAKLLEVAFEFSEKAKLANANILSLKLKAYETLLPYSNKIQAYVFALSKAAENALDIFKKEVRSLGIDDYAFIHHSALKEEGHPLGDYMAWLYGSRWGSLLFKHSDFKDKLKVIDTLDLPGPLLMHDTPSDHIAKIYVSAIFEEHIGNLEPNPKYNNNGLPQLTFGDIFTKDDGSYVWMVINPQCDLVRKVSSELSILLIPGKLSSLNDSLEKVKKTDFFTIKDIAFRIYWQLDEVTSIPYKNVPEWMKKEQLDRTHRLKLPFALDIQQSFASNISRIGIPVAPPANQKITIEVLTRRDGKPFVILNDNNDIAFKLINRDNNGEKYKIQLTMDFAVALKLALVENLQQLSSIQESLAENVNKKLSNDIQLNKKFIDEFDVWFFKNYSFNFSDKISQLDKDIPNNYISVQADTNPEKYAASTLFLINLKTQGIVENTTNGTEAENPVPLEIEIKDNGNKI